MHLFIQLIRLLGFTFQHASWNPTSLFVFYIIFIYIIYKMQGTIIPRIRFLTFPLLIWRGVCESKHGSKPFKLFLSKCFGEDVCNLLICGAMSQMNCFGLWYWIGWYFVLMCLVWSWNLGFLANLIAEVWSINNGVEFPCFSCKYSSIFLSHTISFVTSTAATYFASIVESVGINYWHDL